MKDEIVEAIHAAARQYATDKSFEAAKALLPLLSAEDTQISAILYLSGLVRETQRRERQKVERQHDTLMVKATTPDERVAARVQLSREKFYDSEDGWVEYGKATAEQHERRAQWFQSRIDADTTVRDRHRQAARDIRAAGVTCLDDLVEVPA